jgi:chitodextrinase
MAEKHAMKKIIFGGFGLFALSVVWQLGFGGGTALAAACATPPTDNGTDTMTLSVPANATYTLWVRMLVPDTTNNAINAQIDTTTCFNVGASSSIPANTWTWVNYQNGVTGTPNTVALTSGSHTVKLIGTSAGVEVDRVILTSDTTCTPTGTGDNCATGNNNPPTVSMTAPANNATVSGSSVTLSANASDPSGITQVQFLVDGTVVGTDTTSPYSYTWNSTSVSNGTHTIAAQATDGASISGSSSNVSVTVNNAVSCTTAPTVPTGLAVSGKTANTVSLSWNASTPGSGCTLSGYKLYRGGTLVGTIASGTAYTDTGLTPSTTYSYTIAATDTSSHTSSQSGAVSATTNADTTAPSAPTNVGTTLITSNTIALSWTASTDNVGVTGYRIFRNGTQVGTSTAAAYTDSGLSATTQYAYTVKAVDAAGNLSAASTSINATTLAGSSVTGDVNGDGKVNITDLSIMLSHWNATGATLSQGDVNGDGSVNITDLSMLLSNWTG